MRLFDTVVKKLLNAIPRWKSYQDLTLLLTKILTRSYQASCKILTRSYQDISHNVILLKAITKIEKAEKP